MAGSILITITGDGETVEVWAKGDFEKVVRKIRRAVEG